MNDKIVKMRIGFSSIVIFRDILKNKVIKKLIRFLEAYDDDKNNQIKLIDYYSDFLYELFKYNKNIADYLLTYIFKDDNIYINKYIKKDNLDYNLEESLKNELNFFEFLSSFDFNTLFSEEYSSQISKLDCDEISFYEVYKNI